MNADAKVKVKSDKWRVGPGANHGSHKHSDSALKPKSQKNVWLKVSTADTL
jgi:hypothetical protein